MKWNLIELCNCRGFTSVFSSFIQILSKKHTFSFFVFFYFLFVWLFFFTCKFCSCLGFCFSFTQKHPAVGKNKEFSLSFLMPVYKLNTSSPLRGCQTHLTESADHHRPGITCEDINCASKTKKKKKKRSPRQKRALPPKTVLCLAKSHGKFKFNLSCLTVSAPSPIFSLSRKQTHYRSTLQPTFHLRMEKQEAIPNKREQKVLCCHLQS